MTSLVWISWMLSILSMTVNVYLVRSVVAYHRSEQMFWAEHRQQIVVATSASYIALNLRWLADEWDSTDNQALLERLAREHYSPGGPSMPAIWMRYKADQLEGKN